MQRRTQRVEVDLSRDELAVLDEIRGSTPRSVFVRSLIERASPLPDVASYDEAMALLTSSARAGVAVAQIHLVKFLREQQSRDSEDDVDSAIAKILGDED